jgi:hypothetical protein
MNGVVLQPRTLINYTAGLVSGEDEMLRRSQTTSA